MFITVVSATTVFGDIFKSELFEDPASTSSGFWYANNIGITSET